MESTRSGYNPKIHHRRSIRLKGYDYSKAGLYFITICCQNRICRFGKIVVIRSEQNTMGRPQGYAPTVDKSTVDKSTVNKSTSMQSEIQIMKLNDAGKMVDEQWQAMVNRFPNVELHEYCIMPNHFHCILEIVEGPVGEPLVGTQSIKGRPQGSAPTSAPTSASTNTPTSAPTSTPTNIPTTAPTTDRLTTNTPTYTSPTDTKNDGKPKNKTIGDMMDAFKSIITVEYIRGVKNKGWERFDGKLLQRDYYEHIIRDEHEYQRISEYIINNPSKWKGDKFYSE